MLIASFHCLPSENVQSQFPNENGSNQNATLKIRGMQFSPMSKQSPNGSNFIGKLK